MGQEKKEVNIFIVPGRVSARVPSGEEEEANQY
jgi:hypothetical protein